MTKLILHGAKIQTEFKLLPKKLRKCKINRTKFACKTKYEYISEIYFIWLYSLHSSSAKFLFILSPYLKAKIPALSLATKVLKALKAVKSCKKL